METVEIAVYRYPDGKTKVFVDGAEAKQLKVIDVESFHGEVFCVKKCAQEDG